MLTELPPPPKPLSTHLKNGTKKGVALEEHIGSSDIMRSDSATVIALDLLKRASQALTQHSFYSPSFKFQGQFTHTLGSDQKRAEGETQLYEEPL